MNCLISQAEASLSMWSWARYPALPLVLRDVERSTCPGFGGSPSRLDPERR